MNRNAIRWNITVDDEGNNQFVASSRILDPEAWLQWAWEAARYAGNERTQDEWLEWVEDAEQDETGWDQLRAPSLKIDWDDVHGYVVCLSLPRGFSKWSDHEQKLAWSQIVSHLRAGLRVAV